MDARAAAPIRIELLDAGILGLRLDRPGASNAVDLATIEELERILASPALEGARFVILTGSGERAFCAGGDLRYFSTLDSAEKAEAMSRRVQGLLHRLWAGPQVVIAAVNGAAVGGGCELLTAAHFRVAARHASFRFVQAKHGLTPGWGGSGRLARLLGPTRAADLLLTARRLDAEEALRIGLVDRVTDSGAELEGALALARAIRENHASGVQAIQRLLRQDDEQRLRAANEAEARAFAEGWRSREFWKVCARLLERA